MEKLIMLIDIYEEEVVGVHSVGDKITDKDVARIVSKKFGFVKRLMDNNKINYLTIKSVFKYDYLDVVAYSDYESTLMLLAISDNPIEDLIDYLIDDETERIDKLLDGAKRTCENIGI